MPSLSRLSRVRTPVLVLTAVILTAGVTSAATAQAVVHYVVAGGTTKTTTQTVITDTTKGNVPLRLNANGAAPLYVNSTTRVGRLNADLIDGLDSAAFARTAGRTGIVLDGSDGNAVCPAGTVLTGGGGFADLPGPDANTPGKPSSLSYSGPGLTSTGALVPNSWTVFGVNDTDLTTSFAVCYNPKGAVPGALSAAAVATLATKAPALKRLAARR